jgi:hypothetical protein
VINTALQQLFNNIMNILDTLTFTYNTPSAQQATKAMLDVIMTPTGGAPHVLTTLTLVSATAAAAGLMSAEDKRKVDRMLTDFRSLSFSDTTAVADQATKIVQTLSATLGENPEAVTTMTFLAATASKAGLLSAADKAKLDALWSSGYQFAGIATPSTTPISTTSKIFYIATEAGTYFNAVTVTKGINILSWNGSTWSAVQVVGIDDEPTAGSHNLVESGSVYSATKDLKKSISSEELLIPYSVTADSFVNSDGEIVSFEGVEIDEYHVTQGTDYTVRLSRSEGFSSLYIVNWFNDNGEKVGADLFQERSESEITIENVVTAPQDAVAAYINIQTSRKDSLYFHKLNAIGSAELKTTTDTIVNIANQFAKESSSSHGVYYTNIEYNKYKISGTSTSTSFYEIFKGEIDGLSAGDMLLVGYDGVSSRLRIYSVDASNNYTELSGTNSLLHIPNNYDKIAVRLWVASDQTVNEVVSPIVVGVSKLVKMVLDSTIEVVGIKSYDSCDDIYENCVVTVSSSAGVKSIPDAPFVGWIVNTMMNNVARFQLALPYNNGNVQYRSCLVDGEWNDWKMIGSGGGNTYNYDVTQNITRDTFNNQYSIDVSPIITTDSNGWLQPVDTDTADETGKTDMTSAIMAMLNSTGYCHLAPGIFYVSGNIDMPEGSLLEGCGKDTIIRLLSSVSSGYICRMHTKSTIRSVCFSGAYSFSESDIESSDIGTRNGIIYIGNRNGGDQGVTPRTTTCCMISECWFENFSGSAIYGYNSGGGLQEGMICNNNYITMCSAGINLDYWVEYCKFTNNIIFKCHYACINNGGNNVFTACTFHGVIGFLVDNSNEDKQNNSHGSVIGCTFNHINNWNNPSVLGMGEAVKIIGPVYNGFVFTGCQFWYGSINVTNSSVGISFTNCLIGGNSPVVNIDNASIVFFANCIFMQAPTISASSLTKFDNCYNGSTGAIIRP